MRSVMEIKFDQGKRDGVKQGVLQFSVRHQICESNSWAETWGIQESKLYGFLGKNVLTGGTCRVFETIRRPVGIRKKSKERGVGTEIRERARLWMPF